MTVSNRFTLPRRSRSHCRHDRIEWTHKWGVSHGWRVIYYPVTSVAPRPGFGVRVAITDPRFMWSTRRTESPCVRHNLHVIRVDCRYEDIRTRKCHVVTAESPIGYRPVHNKRYNRWNLRAASGHAWQCEQDIPSRAAEQQVGNDHLCRNLADPSHATKNASQSRTGCNSKV